MRNIEALRNYFLGKDPQLKETMSDNSLRLSGIEGKYYVLRTELIKRLADLKKFLEDADKILQDNIDAEALTRGQADNTLQGNIDAEALARQNADNALESKIPFKKLTADITIPKNSELNPLLLSTGWWYTGEHVIYYGENVDPTIHNNALFYFNADADDQWFYFLPPNLEDGWNQLGTYLWFDNTDHIWQYSGYGVVTTIDNHSTDMSIPTAGAVYEFVNNQRGIKEITDTNMRLWTTQEGIYRLVGDGNVSNISIGYSDPDFGLHVDVHKGTIMIVSPYTETIGDVATDYVCATIVEPGSATAAIETITTTENSGIYSGAKNVSTIETTQNKVNEITSSSTNDQYPGAKAVYDFVQAFATANGLNMP